MKGQGDTGAVNAFYDVVLTSLRRDNLMMMMMMTEKTRGDNSHRGLNPRPINKDLPACTMVVR